ncbi:MAG: Sec-independent protein translocase protein TatAy [Polaribacter sp. SA4-10]|jgi:sec-independent protein translocase protein TatA|nr:MAG: Sec-independent protein translocase protein TatAy [Polaribacter sp. SA4-10]|tara:strand:+ start:263 stop:469 length:207 start_codon:yes stop_codon:yes gene_type:complete
MISLNIFLLGMPSPLSMALIVGALLLLFGGKKIPELMKGIGGGIKEFKKATKDENKAEKKDEKLEEGN